MRGLIPSSGVSATSVPCLRRSRSRHFLLRLTGYEKPALSRFCWEDGSNFFWISSFVMSLPRRPRGARAFFLRKSVFAFDEAHGMGMASTVVPGTLRNGGKHCRVSESVLWAHPFRPRVRLDPRGAPRVRRWGAPALRSRGWPAGRGRWGIFFPSGGEEGV